MIAPTGPRCKRDVGRRQTRDATECPVRSPIRAETRRHGIVSGIIIPPHFRQATAPLGCEKILLRWPGPFSSGFLSPQPPGAVGIGPVRRIVYPHTGPTKVGPFSFWGTGFSGLCVRTHAIEPSCKRTHARHAIGREPANHE